MAVPYCLTFFRPHENFHLRLSCQSILSIDQVLEDTNILTYFEKVGCHFKKTKKQSVKAGDNEKWWEAFCRRGRVFKNWMAIYKTGEQVLERW